MRVICLSTGVVRGKRAQRGPRRYLPGGWSDDVLPVNVFAIEHRDGICVFDAGQTARAAVPGYLPRWHPFLRLSRFELGPEDEAAAQLRRKGIEPTDVRWLVLSHMHNDHVGGLEGFVPSEVLVSRVEWERSTGLAGRLRGYLPQHWPREIKPRLIDFEGGRLGPFRASFDIVGDGRLVLVPTPGHTPGHMALLAREEDRGYLFAGDMVIDAAELPRVWPEVSQFCRRGNLTVLTSHDSRAARLARHGSAREMGPA